MVVLLTELEELKFMIKIKSEIDNNTNATNICVFTYDRKTCIDIDAKKSGYGLIVNGGERLFLALATR